MSPLLEARSVVRVLGRGDLRQRVLHGVSLEVRPREFVALTGASGSGKSTLLYLLGALDQPDSGEIFFAGKSLTSMTDDERATFRGRHLGYVFQFHFLLPELDVMENVALPMLRQGTPEREANERALAALSDLGLGDLPRRRPGHLSGGQQQRVAIARAIAHRPSLILADEPTGALDSKNGAAVVAALRHLSSTRGTAVVMVTHDSELAATCDRRVVLTDGKISDDARASATITDATGEHLAAMIHLAEEADAETMVFQRDATDFDATVAMLDETKTLNRNPKGPPR